MLPLPDANFRAKTQKGARTGNRAIQFTPSGNRGIGQMQMKNFSEEKINY
jgi:hypothetical protein